VCRRCYKTGHSTEDCSSKFGGSSKKAQQPQKHDDEDVVCRRCYKTGHSTEDCSSKFGGSKKVQQRQKQRKGSSVSIHYDIVCCNCDKMGHYANDCPDKKQPPQQQKSKCEGREMG
jgi:hypothetical protein